MCDLHAERSARRRAVMHLLGSHAPQRVITSLWMVAIQALEKCMVSSIASADW
jgi:hypothetical protein